MVRKLTPANDGRVFETYWTTGRSVEALMTSYHALDLTVFGRRYGVWTGPGQRMTTER
jgi:predicted dithiol-disulfide oxidoreductase (DUF899 family)